MRLSRALRSLWALFALGAILALAATPADATSANLLRLRLRPAASLHYELATPQPYVANGATSTFAGYTWTAQNASQAWSLLKSPVANVYRFEIREGDEWPGDSGDVPAKERSELSSASLKNTYGADYWASDSVRYTSPTWDGVRSIRSIISQLHATTGSSLAIWRVEVLPGGNFQVRTSYDTTVGFTSHVEVNQYTSTTNLADGAWHSFVFHWKTTALTTGGVLEIWLDGVKIVDLPNVQMGYLNDSGGAYFKFGTYRQTHSDTIVAEFANLEYGTADLSARITAPLSVPPGAYAANDNADWRMLATAVIPNRKAAA